MAIYYIFFAFLMVSLLIYSDRTFSTIHLGFRRRYYGLCVIVLTVFACVRGSNVGEDTKVYIYIFNHLQNVPWQSIIAYSKLSKIEIGYIVYNKILSVISKEGQIVTIGNSILMMVFAGMVMRKECRNPMYALFIFYTIGMYQSSFNITSSMIASYIAYCGFGAIRERKFLKFFCYILVATFFHTAALVLIPLYFIYPLRLDVKRITLVLAVGLLVAIYINRLLAILTRFIPGQYTIYLERTSDNGLVLLFHFLVLAVVLIVQLASTGNLKTYNDEEVRVHAWAVLFELVLLTLAMRINIFTRVAFMFMPSMPIFIDQITGRITVKNNRGLLYIGIVFAIGLQYILRLQINNIGGSAPYYFFWNA